MRQTQVKRSTNKIDSRARREAYAALDASTERVLEDALKASKRARKLLRQLNTI